MRTATKRTRALALVIAALAMVLTFFAMTSTSVFAASRYDMTPKYDENGNQIVGYSAEDKDAGYDATTGLDVDTTTLKIAGATAVAAAPQLASAAALGTVSAATVAIPSAAATAMAAPLTAAEFAAPLLLL